MRSTPKSRHEISLIHYAIFILLAAISTIIAALMLRVVLTGTEFEKGLVELIAWPVMVSGYMLAPVAIFTLIFSIAMGVRLMRESSPGKGRWASGLLGLALLAVALTASAAIYFN